MKIQTISIQNYKSIKELTNLTLENINIFIGPNGVGKSNFISFFMLLKQIANKNLQEYTAEKAGASKILHFGGKVSPFMSGSIVFDSDNIYQFELKPDSDDSFFFSQEIKTIDPDKPNKLMSNGHKESILLQHQDLLLYVRCFIDFEIYHFYDTGPYSPLKKTCDVNDNRFLRKDGSNIAAYLLYLKEREPHALEKIEDIVRQVAPFFDCFALEPLRRSPEMIKLEWREKGSDEYFNADQLSDGTLRMIALATLLVQPTPPETIIIDDPELGLHPAAIKLLAEMIREASVRSQIIIATQSVMLVNQFNPADLVIVERQDGVSTFKRLEQADAKSWLKNYSMGKTWKKDIVGSRP